MLAHIQAIWRFILEMLFPAFCLGCRAEGTYLCAICIAAIPGQECQVCPLCYKKSEAAGGVAGVHGEGAVCASGGAARAPCGDVGVAAGAVCGQCRKEHPDFALDGLISCSVFAEKSLLQKSIHAFKYDFVEDLAVPLAQLLIEMIETGPFLQDFVICPVPLHKKRLRWRGFNQAELLAARMAAVMAGHGAGADRKACVAGIRQIAGPDAGRNCNPVMHLLTRTAYRTPQMELTREQRLKNVANAFEFAGAADFSGAADVPEKVLLVDDVATTLSTLDACATALKKAGVKTVYGIVLARVY